MSPDVNSDTRSDRPRVPHGAAVAAVHLRVSFLNELQYRSNFFLQIMQSVLQAVSGLVVVALVFAKTTELNGWDRSELLAAVGVFTVVGGILRTFVQPPLSKMVDEVQEGSFDFTLSRPVDAQLLVSVREISMWQLIDVAVGMIIIAVATPDLPSELSITDITVFLVMLGAGTVIAYCLWLALACSAFWVVKPPYMDNLFYYVARAAQYPISIYPTWLRISLTTLIPLGIAVTAPAEAITSRLSWATAATIAAVTLACVAISRTLWTRGVRRYSGASS